MKTLLKIIPLQLIICFNYAVAQIPLDHLDVIDEFSEAKIDSYDNYIYARFSNELKAFENSIVQDSLLLYSEEEILTNLENLEVDYNTHIISYEFRQLESFDSLPGRLFQKGYQDGRIYFRNKGTFWGAFGVGLVTPYTYLFPGLAAGVAMGATAPKINNLRYHDQRMLYSNSGFYADETNKLFDDLNYSRGYQKGAHKRKMSNVAGGMGAGLGTGIMLGVIIVLSVISVY